MPAYASWFRVHPSVVLAQLAATLDQLADPANTVALLDLHLVGVDGPSLRSTLADLHAELTDHLARQSDDMARLAEVRADRQRATEAFWSWRQRLFARLRLAARQGADPEGSFAKVFGYRKVPQARAAGLVEHGHQLLTALNAREASLARHGIHASVVAEGRATHRALVSLHQEVADTTADQKAATAKVHAACAEVQRQLLILVAADDAAALEAGRPSAFTLDVLRPT